MDRGKIGAFRKESLSLFIGAFLIFGGIVISGQGCADMDKYIQESQREHKLKQQMGLAEDELKKGNLVAARTLFDWVRKESKRPSTRERSLFFSGFSVLLDKSDKYRWDQARRIFLSVSERFSQGEFSQISKYVAAGLSDALSVAGALQKDLESIGQEIDLERSNIGEKEKLVQKQKKQLLEKTNEIAALKNSIQTKDEEIDNLKLQIKKLEEIYKEIKEKRKGLS